MTETLSLETTYIFQDALQSWFSLNCSKYELRESPNVLVYTYEGISVQRQNVVYNLRIYMGWGQK